MPSSVGAKRRTSWHLAAALAPLALGLAEPALAQTCTPVSGGISCSGSFTTNINNNTNITLQPGVTVASPGGDAVNTANSTGITPGSANLSIIANATALPITINNTANAGGSNNTGLRIQSSGDAIITATNTTIDVAGTASDHGIVAFAMPNLTGLPHAASVTWSGPGITSSGTESTGIQADNRGIGDATIVASGNVTVTPGVGRASVYGLIAHSGDSLLVPSGAGNASVTYQSGTITVFGDRPRGIVVWAGGDGSATVTTAPGTVIAVSGSDTLGGTPTLPVRAAVAVQLDSATAASGRSLTATVASTITNSGRAAPDSNIFSNPVGIRTISYVDAPSTVTLTRDGSITTQGGGGAGIQALSASGSITVNALGAINTTNGSNAVGILADSGTILARTNGLLADTSAIRPGIVLPTSTTGSVLVSAANVSTTGQFGAGISATAGSGGAAVNVLGGGSVMGGWQADLAGIGPTYGLPSVGVFLSSTGGTALLTNDGSIGAMSDRAVAGDPQVVNNGSITGFVQFTGGGHSFINNGTFNLRHFADTNGDGVRDTVRVAIADLGAGVNNSFTNNGNTLTLPQVVGATTLDSTGQYLPLGNPNNAMALGGPLQGHMIGVATFTNSGTIDLQSNPSAGDVLVITGARQAGVAGPGTFISNGGTLKLDTVLNQGGAATRSDTLVVDATSVGPAGPTIMAIRNAGGGGALTVGDGILVTQVLNPALSASGAFRLAGGTVSAGAYDYVLFKGGVSPGSQGNWYLRSTLVAPTDPTVSAPEAAPDSPLLPTPVPGAAPIVLYRPEVALHAVLPSIARAAVRTTLGTFHDREGEQVFASGDGAFQAGWARVFGGSYRQSWSGDVSPAFNGSILGVQVGMPFFDWDHSNGEKDRAGVFLGYTYASGGVTGFARGQQGFPVGNVGLNAYSVGLYWTHFWPAGGYLDAVLMQSFITSSTSSVRNISTSSNGRIGTASLELGYPIRLSPDWAIEPQAQFIFQRWGNDLLNDTFAQVSTVEDNAFTARFGLRLTGNLVRDRMVIKPFALANLWHGFDGQDTIAFNQTSVITNQSMTALEFGGGVSASIGKSTDVYAKATYTTGIDGNFQSAYTGKLGFRVIW